MPPRPGKAPGAFAHPTVPSAHPYLLLNYHGRTRDVMTLAHELGHGVHQVLAAPQGQLLCDTPLTLAETASVFGEMLTFQALLKRETDPEERRVLLAGKVEDMLNTVVRQIAMHEYRAAAARRAARGRAVARPNLRDLAGDPARGAGRRRRSAGRHGLRDLLDLHPAFHPCAVLRLRLCLRRLPGELALCGLSAGRSRLRGEISRHAEGRRHQAAQGIAGAVRPRRLRSRPSGPRASAW